MRRVYWDTMIFAYWLEGHQRYKSRIDTIHSQMIRRGDVLCSSTLVLAELLVGPLRTGDASAADGIERYFRSPEVTMLEFAPRTARVFAQLRAAEGLKPVDSFHLAVAASAGVDIFLTNDRRLHKVIVPGISFIGALEDPLF